MRTLFVVLSVLLLGVTGGAAQETTPLRVALVIGNGAYTAVQPLDNPVRDARLIEAALKRTGFDVVAHYDATKPQVDAALRAFSRKAARADVALVYYAGHGIQLEQENWIIPVDAQLEFATDARSEAVRLEDVIAIMGPTRKLRIVVLDACRDNPFTVRFASAGRALTRGLAPVEGLPGGTVVAFSAGPGQQASDRPATGGENSPYALALARRMLEPGVELSQVLRRVRGDVMRDAPPQEPWANESRLDEDFYFVPVATRGSPRPPPTAVGSVFRDCDKCPDMVILPPGTFRMGSPENEPGRRSNEAQRIIPIRAFAMSKFEITATQWRACKAAGRCTHPGGVPIDINLPVTDVSWHDAELYVAWLNEQAGARVYRLPSEAEWEYAARAGASTAYAWGPTASHERANYGAEQCCRGARDGRDTWDGPAPVGSFPANAFGLHDMHGNVWEWTADCYSETADLADAIRGDCRFRVLRGGSWYGDPQNLRAALRLHDYPTHRAGNGGFRVARTL